MKTNLVAVCFFSFISYFISAQNYEDDILLTINDNAVKTSEFIRIYKKNLDLVKDDSQKDIEAYLDLFIMYKLKVEEAKSLGYDQQENLKKELKNYRQKLVKNYLTNNEVTEALVKEAYERSAYRIKASHVLVAIPDYETDTIAAYYQIQELRKRLLNEGFETLKNDVHNGTTIYAEDLGSFSTFDMVYDFENVAYNTKIGTVSEPFRTEFGYHVVQVFDKQKSKGEVTIGHIMISKAQKNNTTNPQERINEIYNLIQNGQQFEDVAKQFSEDKNSAQKGGKLGNIKEGTVRVKAFEDVAFSLTLENNISKPFETDRSWHIIKLYDQKPYGTYNDLKNNLEREVKRNGRSAKIDKALIASLLKRYKISYKQSELPYFKSIINDSYFNDNWRVPSDFPKEKKIFSIKGNTYTFNDFVIFLKNNNKKYQIKDTDLLINLAYEAFVNKTLLNYYEDNLENENSEFANTLLEFKEGLLLYEFMSDKIWNVANKDSLGLKAFYNKNKSNYIQKSTIDATVATSINTRSLKRIKKLWKTVDNIEHLREVIEKEGKNVVIITDKTIERDDTFLPEDFKFETGISKVFSANNTFHILKINNIKKERLKTFDEAKGSVINDYQKFIENQILEELTAKYEINIDKNVLNNIKAKLN